MENFVIILLICSVTMSMLALVYMAITPIVSRRYSAKSRYYAWLIIVIGLIIPFRPQFDNALVQIDMPTGVAPPSAPTSMSISLWQSKRQIILPIPCLSPFPKEYHYPKSNHTDLRS